MAGLRAGGAHDSQGPCDWLGSPGWTLMWTLPGYSQECPAGPAQAPGHQIRPRCRPRRGLSKVQNNSPEHVTSSGG